MDALNLHDWDVSPTEAVRLQHELRGSVKIEPLRKTVRWVAGADISFDKDSPTVFAAFVVLDAATLEPVAEAHAIRNVHFPYVPGLLSFREIPPLLEAWSKLGIEPDVVVFDGQGIAHPRRMGIASHMGLLINRPSIGCAKSLLTGEFRMPAERAGSRSPLFDRGERVGTALRTKDRVSPVFASPGHLIDFEATENILLASVRGYRIPEPTRQAHLLVNRLRVAANDRQVSLF